VDFPETTPGLCEMCKFVDHPSPGGNALVEPCVEVFPVVHTPYHYYERF
jgi:hypothetical protein